MPPPMISASTLFEQVLDDADLVADFGAAEDGDERLLGVLQGPAQILQFLFHEQSGGGFLHELGDADGGGVGAMRRAEGIVDVEVGELGELPGEFLVVVFFFGVEAQVFEQQRLAFFQLEWPFLRLPGRRTRDRSRRFRRAPVLCRAACAGARPRA